MAETWVARAVWLASVGIQPAKIGAQVFQKARTASGRACCRVECDQGGLRRVKGGKARCAWDGAGPALLRGPGGRDLGEVAEEARAGAGGEGGKGGAEGVVADVELGAICRVGGIEPTAVTEEPVACQPARGGV